MSEQGIAASRALSEQYAEVVAALKDEDWARPSRCAGWSVQDLVAHTGSNFKVLVEPPTPPADPDPSLAAERAQDLLVQARRDWTPAQVREEFEAYRPGAMDVLAAMQAEPTASALMTLNDLGTYPMAELADAFAFDLYCHLTVDLLAPTGPVTHPLPEVPDEVLRPGIGWMLTGLPQMCPKVNGSLTAPLGLRLTGPGGGEWTLVPGDTALTVREGLLDPAAVATSSARDFVLWGTTRTPWREAVTVTGDEDVAVAALEAVNIV